MIGSVRSGMTAAAAQSLDREMNHAISDWNLRQLGWRGFEKIDWVRDIMDRYPAAPEIASTCSSHRPGYLDQVQELFDEALPEHRQTLHHYFLGKLGLEELSCRMNGAAAAACDKRAAFLEICHLTRRLAREA